MKKLLQIAVIAIMLLPVVAMADLITPSDTIDTWELYTFGNGVVIRDILTATKLMTADSSYTSLLVVMATIGILVVAVTASIGFRLDKFFTYLLTAWLLTYAIMQIEINIDIIDPLTGDGLVGVDPGVVENVPAAVGLPIVFFSRIGHTMNEWIEQYYSIPGDLKITGGGTINMASKIITDMTAAQPSADLNSSLIYYFNDCVIPKIFTGAIPSNTLLQSNDLWADVQVIDLALSTRYFVAEPEGRIESCASAYGLLTADLNAEAPNMIETTADVWHQADAFGFMSGAIPSALTWLGSGAVVATGTAESAVKQNAIIGVYNRTYQRAAAMTGSNELLTALNIEQSKQSQKSTWVVAAELFKDLAGYFYAVLQAFIMGIAPIVFVGILVPGFGVSVITSYLKVMAWLVLWEPTLGIVNFIMLTFAKQDMQYLLSAGPESWNISLENIGQLSEAASNMTMVSGFLATLIPLLTWQLVNKGGMGFTEFLSKGIGGGESASAGKNIAAGDFSADNISMDNTRMGKYDMSRSIAVGYGAVDVQQGAGSANHRRDGGGQSYSAFGQQLTSTDNAVTTASSTAATGSMVANQVAGASKQNYERATSSMVNDVFSRTGGITIQGGSEDSAGQYTDAGQKAAREFNAFYSRELGNRASKEDYSGVGGSIHAQLSNLLPKNFRSMSDPQKQKAMSGAIGQITSKQATAGMSNSSKGLLLDVALLAGGILLAAPTGGGSVAAAAGLLAGRAGVSALLRQGGWNAVKGTAGKLFGKEGVKSIDNIASSQAGQNMLQAAVSSGKGAGVAVAGGLAGWALGGLANGLGANAQTGKTFGSGVHAADATGSKGSTSAGEEVKTGDREDSKVSFGSSVSLLYQGLSHKESGIGYNNRETAEFIRTGTELDKAEKTLSVSANDSRGASTPVQVSLAQFQEGSGGVQRRIHAAKAKVNSDSNKVKKDLSQTTIAAAEAAATISELRDGNDAKVQSATVINAAGDGAGAYMVQTQDTSGLQGAEKKLLSYKADIASQSNSTLIAQKQFADRASGIATRSFAVLWRDDDPSMPEGLKSIPTAAGNADPVGIVSVGNFKQVLYEVPVKDDQGNISSYTGVHVGKGSFQSMDNRLSLIGTSMEAVSTDAVPAGTDVAGVPVYMQQGIDGQWQLVDKEGNPSSTMTTASIVRDDVERGTGINIMRWDQATTKYVSTDQVLGFGLGMEGSYLSPQAGSDGENGANPPPLPSHPPK